jgi:hypothetical protein
MVRRRREDEPEPARPSCSSCGEPARFEVGVEVRELELSDHSPSGRRHWTAAYYRGQGTEIRTVLCFTCVKRDVTVKTSVRAEVRESEEP